MPCTETDKWFRNTNNCGVIVIEVSHISTNKTSITLRYMSNKFAPTVRQRVLSDWRGKNNKIFVPTSFFREIEINVYFCEMI